MFDLALATGATFTAEECAAVAGCLPQSWLSMVTRRFAPPSRGFCPETGVRVWDVNEVLAWQAARPGRGNWVKKDARSSRHMRTRSYSFGGEPAWRESTASTDSVKMVRPRLPFIPR